MYYIIINEVSDYQWSVKIKTQKYYKIIFVFLKKFDTAYKQDWRTKIIFLCQERFAKGRDLQENQCKFLLSLSYTGILYCQMLFFSTVLFIFANFAFSFTCKKLIIFFFHLNMNYKRINIPLETWDHQLPAQGGERV